MAFFAEGKIPPSIFLNSISFTVLLSVNICDLDSSRYGIYKQLAR